MPAPRQRGTTRDLGNKLVSEKSRVELKDWDSPRLMTRLARTRLSPTPPCERRPSQNAVDETMSRDVNSTYTLQKQTSQYTTPLTEMWTHFERHQHDLALLALSEDSEIHFVSAWSNDDGEERDVPDTIITLGTGHVTLVARRRDVLRAKEVVDEVESRGEGRDDDELVVGRSGTAHQCSS